MVFEQRAPANLEQAHLSKPPEPTYDPSLRVAGPIPRERSTQTASRALVPASYGTIKPTFACNRHRRVYWSDPELIRRSIAALSSRSASARPRESRTDPEADRDEVIEIVHAITIHVGPADHPRVSRALYLIPNQDGVREVDDSVAVDITR